MSSTRSTEAPVGSARTEPLAFVAEAQRATNEADVPAAAALYAPDATMRVVFDGAEEVHRGQAAIAAAWQAYFPSLYKHGFKVEKKLLAADDDTIVNDWTGGLGERSNAYGLEVWRFSGGAVVDHVLVGYLDIRPTTSWLARMRMGMGAPRLGMTLLRASRGTR